MIGLLLHLLVTGVFWGTWFTLTRSIDSFSPSEFIHIGKVIIANVALPMRIILPSSILLLILWVWWYPERTSAGFYLAVIALILLVATLLITLLVLVPIDNQIKEWSPETIPTDWISLRDRWQTFHEARTFTSLASFGCFAMSVISNRSRE